MFFITLSAIMEYNRLCDKYDDVSIRAVGDKYRIPYTTFWKWVTGHIKGTGYQSGGKGYCKIFSEGMFWSIFYFYFFFFSVHSRITCTYCCRQGKGIGRIIPDVQPCRLSTFKEKSM